MTMNRTFMPGDNSSLPSFCLEEEIGDRKVTAYAEEGGSIWCIMVERGKEFDKTDDLFKALKWLHDP